MVENENPCVSVAGVSVCWSVGRRSCQDGNAECPGAQHRIPDCSGQLDLCSSTVITFFTDTKVVCEPPVERDVCNAVDVMLVLQGAGKLLRDSRKHPAQLRSEVCTPGGTTIYGLHTLEQGGVRAATMSAVESATERARELGLKSGGRSTKWPLCHYRLLAEDLLASASGGWHQCEKNSSRPIIKPGDGHAWNPEIPP